MKRRRAHRRVIGAPALVIWAIAGCSAAAGPTPDPDSSGSVVQTVLAGLPRPAHVLVVIFENKSASEVVGHRSARYLTHLADHGAYFVNAHGVAHPSEPNYLALSSGSTHGVTSDASPLHLGRKPSLAEQLAAAGSPTVAFVVPNLCHDMHDCSVSVGDPVGAKASEPLRQLGANSSEPARRHL
jgi:acid phosphatase